jgi:hypothetical protein
VGTPPPPPAVALARPSYFGDFYNLYPRRVSSRTLTVHGVQSTRKRASRDWLIPIGPIGDTPSFVRAFE